MSEVTPEIKEREPQAQVLMKVDLIRHGRPEYSKDESMTSQFEGELTPEGQEQMRLTGLGLLPNIKKDEELVVIWASPKRRARESADIIKKILSEGEIPVLGIKTGEIRTRESLKDVRFTKEFGDELSEKRLWREWMRYWLEAEEELPKGVERPKEVQRRVMRVLTYLTRIAQRVKPQEGRRLHFVLVGHEELFPFLLKEAFSLGAEAGPGYGEVLGMEIRKIPLPDSVQLGFEYRQQKSSLNFNYKERQLKK